jgi:hypothetical protein
VSKVTQDLLELDPQLGETLQRQRSQSASQRSHHSETGSIRSRTRSGSDVKPKDVTDPKIIMDGKLTDTEKAETGSVSSVFKFSFFKLFLNVQAHSICQGSLNLPLGSI